MDLLNTAADEKLGYLDFAYATQDVPLASQYEVVDNFLVPKGQPYIISGFGSYITNSFLNVQAGTAFLSYRDRNGVVRNGIVTAVSTIPTAVLQKNLAGLTAGTYRAYVRFNLIPSTPENRVYFGGLDANGKPQWVPQLTNTRLSATWELNLEPAALTMTGEWLPVASITVTGSGATVTDLRTMYFEGAPSLSWAPQWGLTAADRTSTRTLDNGTASSGSTPATDNNFTAIKDLRTMLDALRQCIVDIKGPGLQPWWSPGIGGMNVGNAFATSALAASKAQTQPTDATVALGDAGFRIRGISSLTGVTAPRMEYNAASANGGFWSYARTGGTTADFLTYSVASLTCLGINNLGQLGVGNAASAPAARLHVASNGQMPARFDAGATSAGTSVAYLNGYNAGDKVVYGIGDGLSTAYTQRWGVGQLAASVFGFQNAVSGANFYTYTTTTQTHLFAGTVVGSGTISAQILSAPTVLASTAVTSQGSVSGAYFHASSAPAINSSSDLATVATPNSVLCQCGVYLSGGTPRLCNNSWNVSGLTIESGLGGGYAFTITFIAPIYHNAAVVITPRTNISGSNAGNAGTNPVMLYGTIDIAPTGSAPVMMSAIRVYTAPGASNLGYSIVVIGHAAPTYGGNDYNTVTSS